MEHVQTRLDSSNVQLTDSAQRCKQFLSMHMGIGGDSNRSKGPPKFSDLMMFVNQQGDNNIQSPQPPLKPPSSNPIDSSSFPNNDGAIPCQDKSTSSLTGQDASTIQMVKAYFDLRMHDMEKRILQEMKDEMRAMEARQTLKFDTILKALEQRNGSDTHEQIALD